MRKGTKTIRKVSTGSGEYYVYDLEADIHGKRRRLYGKSIEEVEEKIKQATKEKEIRMESQKPTSSKLSDFGNYYFKCMVGEKHATVLQREYTRFESAIKDSEIDFCLTDKDGNSYFIEGRKEKSDLLGRLTAYYQKIMATYNSQAQEEIFGILKETEKTAKKLGAIPADADWKVPEAQFTTEWDFEHFLSEKELNTLIDYCIEDKCKKFSINEAFILLISLTGIPIADVLKLKKKDVKFTDTGADITVSRGTTKKHEIIIKADQRFKETVQALAQYEIFNLKKPNELFVVTGDKKIHFTSVTNTLKRIGNYCGFPDGVTIASLQKAVMILDYKKGMTVPELMEKYKKKSGTIENIIAEYELKKSLF